MLLHDLGLAVTGRVCEVSCQILTKEWEILDHEDRISGDMLLLESKGEEYRNKFMRIFNPFLIATHKPVEVEHEPVGNEKEIMNITSSG